MSRNMDQEISNARVILENPYAYLNGDGSYDALIRNAPLLCANSPLINLRSILGQKRQGDHFSRKEIELIVTQFQRELWAQRATIFSTDAKSDPFELLNPELALRCIGYSVDEAETLGQYRSADGVIEVAGVLDKPNKRVSLSRRLPHNTRSFTAAHELGHALLHVQATMHRDRPEDGSHIRARDPMEQQADYFASFFLMPAKLVLEQFRQRFATMRFVLDESTVFAMNVGSYAEVRHQFCERRCLSRYLADAKLYRGRNFYSLAEVFGVSVETMAIRLEEVGVI